MADILTHYTCSRLAGLSLSRKDECALIAGMFMPDIISKSMLFFLETEVMFGSFSHSLLGALLYSSLFCALFVHKGITRFLKFMVAGYVLHIAIDVFKDYLGYGVVYPFLPFSAESIEVSLYNPYDAVYLAPVNLALLLLVYYFRRRTGAR